MIVPRRVRPLWWHKPAGRANSDHEYESTQASPESRSVSLLQEKDNVSKSCHLKSSFTAEFGIVFEQVEFQYPTDHRLWTYRHCS